MPFLHPNSTAQPCREDLALNRTNEWTDEEGRLELESCEDQLVAVAHDKVWAEEVDEI